MVIVLVKKHELFQAGYYEYINIIGETKVITGYSYGST